MARGVSVRTPGPALRLLLCLQLIIGHPFSRRGCSLDLAEPYANDASIDSSAKADVSVAKRHSIFTLLFSCGANYRHERLPHSSPHDS